MDPRIYQYDINILYNKANSRQSHTSDTTFSLQIAERLEQKTSGWGYKCYYHERDSIPGRNIFKELKRLVESSRLTVVILTKGFVRDCWSAYSQQSAFKKLLDKNSSDRLIPVAVGIREEELPDNLDTANILYLEDDGQYDKNWQQLKNVLDWLPKNTQVQENVDGITRSLVRREPIVQDSPADEEPHVAILDSLNVALIEHMNADLLVPKLRETLYFNAIDLRDVEDIVETSKKNKKIIEIVRSHGEEGYKILKTSLGEIQQYNLVRMLEQKEAELGVNFNVEEDRGSESSRSLETNYSRVSPTGSAPEAMREAAQSNQPPISSAPQQWMRQSVGQGDASNNALEEVIENLEGATLEISNQSNTNMPAQHTTSQTRSIIQEPALASLEMDHAPSIGPGTSMTVESGPKLSLPPVKKVTLPQGQITPTVQLSSSNDPSITNHNTSTNTTEGLNTNKRPTTIQHPITDKLLNNSQQAQLANQIPSFGSTEPKQFVSLQGATASAGTEISRHYTDERPITADVTSQQMSLSADERPITANVTSQRSNSSIVDTTQQYQQQMSLSADKQPIIANVTSQHSNSSVVDTAQQYQQQMSLSADQDIAFDDGSFDREHMVMGQNNSRDDLSISASTGSMTSAESGYSSYSSPDNAPYGTVLTSGPTSGSLENSVTSTVTNGSSDQQLKTIEKATDQKGSHDNAASASGTNRPESTPVKSRPESTPVKSSLESASDKSSLESSAVKSSLEPTVDKSTLESTAVKSNLNPTVDKSSLESTAVKDSSDSTQVKSSLENAVCSNPVTSGKLDKLRNNDTESDDPVSATMPVRDGNLDVNSEETKQETPGAPANLTCDSTSRAARDQETSALSSLLLYLFRELVRWYFQSEFVYKTL